MVWHKPGIHLEIASTSNDDEVLNSTNNPVLDDESSTETIKRIISSNGPVTRKGYFLMERGFTDLHLFKKEPFTEREAWIYLIEHAAYAPIMREISGMAITLELGQLVASYRYLAEAWGWKTKNGLAKDKVKRLIAKFERHGWIKVDTDYYVEHDSFATAISLKYDRRSSLITICNYKELQKKEYLRESIVQDSALDKNETVLRQHNDKPNQNQPNKNIERKNQVLDVSTDGKSARNVFLFQEFPHVRTAEEFIQYMPNYWQNYALDKGWDADLIKQTAQDFWIKYTGKDEQDRIKRQSSLAKRKYWHKVWFKWCDQRFRNN